MSAERNWMTGTLSVLEAVNSDLPDGYSFHLSEEEPLEPGFVALDVVVPSGGTDRLAFMADSEDLFTALRQAQSELIEHRLGVAWPRCPAHGSHPLEPAPDGWRCPSDEDSHWWPFGTLKGTPMVAEPSRGDGEVRWWADDLGWGVVAHHEGDMFVLFASIEADGYRSLREGEEVEYRLSAFRQGRFRRADWVRPTHR